MRLRVSQAEGRTEGETDMMFLIESIVLCLVFTITVPVYGLRDPLSMIDSYPPAIVARAEELGLVPRERKQRAPKVIAGKLVFCLIAAVGLAAILRIFNGADTFRSGFVTSYQLWLVVDWYDALAVDCLWFCHSRRCVIPGTEDMTEAYHDYGFHIRQSCIGMLIGLPECLLVGGLTALLAI